jgi:alkanesulfonate monooxygenase SsuD/methylene tetrahydromethanopterin reductase-like flavin-dependent oxidoreductase (luciferase family)
MNPFRFGVNVGPSRSQAKWAEKARKVEGLGYDALTVPDHPGRVLCADAGTRQRCRGDEDPPGRYERAQ